MKRQNIASGSYLEPVIGFSRAVRVGPHVMIAGTAPIGKDGATAGKGDVYAQTKRCLEIGLAALEEAGASARDVVRSRLILTDRQQWQDATRAHGEVFADIRPACTVMIVSGFVDPDWLVETELDAIIEDQT